ncbi:EpsG family protein [Weissella confusa]|uniref:EpsG family protein n=1 Tax=Weissella confusa TaxID=1583 RepID=UPI0018F21C5F|nr:EpsG family protein [Weissella confusa]MBJ7671169.1 hypothetical protein [Weissella confusa]
MNLYIVSIVITILIIGGNEFYFKTNYSVLRNALDIVGLLPVAIVSGLRNLNVGTDINHYVVPNFTAAQLFSDFFSYNTYVHSMTGNYLNAVNNTESGYNLIVFIVSRFTDNVHWLLFLLQLLVLIFIVTSLKIFAKFLETSVTLGVIVYLLTLYPFTLNVMRQYLAASLVLLAFSTFFAKKKYTSLIILAGAYSIHKSAIMGLLILVGYMVYMSVTKKNHSFANIPLISMMAVMSAVLVGGNVLKLLQGSIQFLPFLNKYAASFAVTGGYKFSGILIYIFPDVLIIVMYFFVIFSSDFLKTNSKLWSYFGYLVTVSLLLNTLYLYQNVIPRLAIFIMIFRPVIIGTLINALPKNMKIIFSGMLVLIFILVFYRILISGNGSVYPYQSDYISNYIFNNY